MADLNRNEIKKAVVIDYDLLPARTTQYSCVFFYTREISKFEMVFLEMKNMVIQC